MKENQENELLNDLKEGKDRIRVRDGFQEELEESLVHGFTKRHRNRMLLPTFAALAAALLFFIIIASGEELFDIGSGESVETPLVYIYHSHTTESYFPELKGVDETDASQANHPSVNITLVGEHLARTLEDNGVPVLFDDTNFSKKLVERGLEYRDSYSVSRENVEAVLQENKSIRMVFDLHRDVLPRQKTTTEIDGEEVARILFVVNALQPNYFENEQFAVELQERLEERYPGLSRGIFVPGVHGNENHNQDLFNSILLVEIGGVENTLEEANRSAEYLAEIVAEMLGK